MNQFIIAGRVRVIGEIKTISKKKDVWKLVNIIVDSRDFTGLKRIQCSVILTIWGKQALYLKQKLNVDDFLSARGHCETKMVINKFTKQRTRYNNFYVTQCEIATVPNVDDYEKALINVPIETQLGEIKYVEE